MKIIYIANARLPTEKAHGFQICKMCESFAWTGYRVVLIIPRRFNWIKKDPFEYYEIERNFSVRKLPCLDLIPWDKYIGHLGMWIETFTFNFFVFFYLLFNKADIIYTREKLLLPLALLKNNLVWECHAFPGHFSVYSFFVKKLRAVIVVTRKLKQLFLEKGVLGRKVLVAPDAVDLRVFDLNLSKERARKKLGLPLDKAIIGYFGRFRTMGMEKGVGYILRALAFLPQEVIFLGAGGSRDDIDYYCAKAKKLKVEQRVIFIERVGQNKLAQYQKACDALLMPFPHNQHYAFYMSPVKMFEHMAAKRPIVSSDLPSIRDILNKENAILVEPDNVSALVEAIRMVLENKKMAQEISAKAYQDVQEHTWQKRAERILHFINRA